MTTTTKKYKFKAFSSVEEKMNNQIISLLDKKFKDIALGETFLNKGFLVFPANKKYKFNRRSLAHIPKKYFLTLTFLNADNCKEIIRYEILKRKYSLYKAANPC